MQIATGSLWLPVDNFAILFLFHQSLFDEQSDVFTFTYFQSFRFLAYFPIVFLADQIQSLH